YRSIVPKKGEIKNLFVPVCLSASHIAFGSIRMEPVFMVLGQSAATAAVMAIDANQPVQEVDVKALQKSLTDNPLADGSTPEIVVDNDHPEWVEVSGDWQQRGGGYGRNHLSIGAGKNGKVSYKPEIVSEGDYEIFMYFTNFQQLSPEIFVQVINDTDTSDITIRPQEIKELGLPSGDWVSLGTYHVKPGSNNRAILFAKGSEKLIVADALLWVPVK